ncbi:hypothetical protein JQ633_33755 [Bradyrhizobium tropiciagri]|uniref:hypothetical protein n=1 Tax=Bradyrhizobium tropiciagri TaxID=312253 RepID=UPI001BA60A66|nr:hypothetical protein [Bradyrhizobium tropiciagri]MBR0875362.1 hypothetical protein [Bradyrhizobium tropiciagri]
MGQHLAIKPRSDSDLLGTLDQLQERYRTIKDGYRESLHQLMAGAMAIALAVEADEILKTRFQEKVGRTNDTVYAALIFITDAKSEAARKKAWKRARALRFLVEELGATLEDIPDTIREHGGVEKLARLAAQDQPRRGKRAKKLGEEDQASSERDADDEPDEADERVDASKSERKAVNFGRRIQVGFSPKLGSKLDRLADRSRIKLIGYFRTRAGEPPTIEIKKIIKLKRSVSDEKPSEAASDWED